MQKLSLWRRLRRSPYQSLAAIVITSLTFFVVTIFALVTLGGHQMLSFFESRPQVTAFFKDDTSSADVSSLTDSVKVVASVVDAKYVSKDEALELYRAQNKDNPLLLEMVTADILPASLEVSTKNVDDLEKVATVMQQDPQVEEVVFQKDVVDTLRKWVAGIRIGGLVLSTIFVLASFVTLILILGLKVTAKKSEIKTLSLLGASAWYIRRPFVSEALLYTILGTTLGWGSAYLALLYLTPNLLGFFEGIPLLPVPIWIMGSVWGAELILGIVLAGAASMVATRRYGR
jgi:cell division transport system permease protein